MIKLSLVIPTYNEAKNLPLLIKEIFEIIDKSKINLEVIIVDDNSPDKTGQVAEELAKSYPITVINRPGKLGLGSAVREGFKRSNRDYLGVMDGDLSHDPKIMNELILSLENFDLTIGSRFKQGSLVEEWVLWRRFVSNLGVKLGRWLTGVDDSLSGYFFLRKKVIENITLTTGGYKILLEILMKGNYNKIKEIPYTFRMRKYSTSKLNLKEFLLFFMQVIKFAFIKYGK